eukprot:1147920-Pelagomonas_calceolata.AAC.1
MCQIVQSAHCQWLRGRREQLAPAKATPPASKVHPLASSYQNVYILWRSSAVKTQAQIPAGGLQAVVTLPIGQP